MLLGGRKIDAAIVIRVNKTAQQDDRVGQHEDEVGQRRGSCDMSAAGLLLLDCSLILGSQLHSLKEI